MICLNNILTGLGTSRHSIRIRMLNRRGGHTPGAPPAVNHTRLTAQKNTRYDLLCKMR